VNLYLVSHAQKVPQSDSKRGYANPLESQKSHEFINCSTEGSTHRLSHRLAHCPNQVADICDGDFREGV